MIGSFLKLYSPVLVLLASAVTVTLAGNTVVMVTTRLVAIAIALGLSIHENRRLDRRRRDERERRCQE